MTDWTDAEISTLIADTLTAHEDDVDPDRARELAFGVEPPRRHWPAIMAASVAALLVCSLAVYIGTRTGDHAAVPATNGPTSGGDATVAQAFGTTAENRQLAIAASEAAVASMPVPEESVQLDGKPEGWPDGESALGPSDWRLTRTAWWSVPMGVAQVVAFLTDHAPAGMRRPPGEDIVVNADSDGVGYTDYDTISPADPAAYTGPSLLVQFKQFGDHTIVRADTFLAARYAVSPQHRIAGEVTAVQIVRVRPAKPFGSGDGGPLPTVRLEALADAAQISELVDAYNGLYGSWTEGGFLSCPFPGDPRPEDTVTFFVRNDDGTDSTVVAKTELACWGQLQATVDGSRLDVTLDPGDFPQTVDQIADAAG
jgi:hypothetical protein